MKLPENIKRIREENNLKQIEVATHIGLDKSAYCKIEKGTRGVATVELQKMAQLFNLTTDEIINYGEGMPKEVVMEDKNTVEQMRLLQQLDDEDKKTIFKLVDKMLTIKRFRDFFEKYRATQ